MAGDEHSETETKHGLSFHSHGISVMPPPYYKSVSVCNSVMQVYIQGDFSKWHKLLGRPSRRAAPVFSENRF